MDQTVCGNSEKPQKLSQVSFLTVMLVTNCFRKMLAFKPVIFYKKTTVLTCTFTCTLKRLVFEKVAILLSFYFSQKMFRFSFQQHLMQILWLKPSGL